MSTLKIVQPDRLRQPLKGDIHIPHLGGHLGTPVETLPIISLCTCWDIKKKVCIISYHEAFWITSAHAVETSRLDASNSSPANLVTRIPAAKKGMVKVSLG